MRKLPYKDIIKNSEKFVAIRLCQGRVLSGCLNLGSGMDEFKNGQRQMNLYQKGEKKAKKNLHPKVESVGELNIL